MTFKKALFATFVTFSVALNATPTADGLYAVFKTSAGEFTAELFYEQAPLSSANMVGLAEGTLPHYASGSTTPIYSKFYDGLTFHRIIDGFVIQGGDPNGNGTGGPGYDWPDEVHPDLKHVGEGILSMANSGANTNGSQFFVTLGTQSHLDGLHNVFGKVVEGIEIVRALGKTPANSSGVPTTAPSIQTIEILRIGEAANAFDPRFYAAHFDPNNSRSGKPVDPELQFDSNSSNTVTVSAPFRPLTDYSVFTSNNLKDWNLIERRLPSLDPDSSDISHTLNLDTETQDFVKVEATMRTVSDMSGVFGKLKVNRGTAEQPNNETVTIESSFAGTYQVHGAEETGGTSYNVEIDWFEISPTRSQLKITFEDTTYIQFYFDKNDENERKVYLRDRYYYFNGQWRLIDNVAEGTFELTTAN